ncbi:MAG: Nif3-like dinuclear metal center hexameric protein [Spirochaetota bacterium]
MKLDDLTKWLDGFLHVADFSDSDVSLNGLQIARKNPEIRKIAFAVDACRESFERAAGLGADMLVVHHGLFWGSPLAIAGMHYGRVATAIEHDLAVYASHLPLDAHWEVGNNAAMADILGLQKREPFGRYHGVTIGIMGELPFPMQLQEVRRALGFPADSPVFSFGLSQEVSRVALVSGGGSSAVSEAVSAGADLFITGELLHQVYHTCLEERLNVISGGHYATEVFGPKALAVRIEKELELETVFVDVPTGL